MIYITDAIYKLYPNVIRTVGDIAFDIDGNQVQYDVTAVNSKAAELEAQEQTMLEAKAAAKQTAINKLMTLGLTEQEAIAIGGTV